MDGAAVADAVFGDFLTGLAGSGPGPFASVTELRAALFETDPITGVEAPRVDGAASGVVLRLRKRPDMLIREWDELLDESLTQLQQNPLSRIAGMQGAIDTLGHDLEAEAGARFIADGEIGITVKHHVADHDARMEALETSTANFIDDWQGELGYLKVEDELIWTHSRDQDRRLEFVNGQVVYLDTRLASTELTVKEVKELADILKSDYARQIGGVQADVDALWLEMVDADGGLQKPIDALFSSTCATNDLATALYSGDLVAQKSAFDTCLLTVNVCHS